ncbi:MAG: helix-turn-helix transcriptional regulator [Ruminiclostridium sp.]
MISRAIKRLRNNAGLTQVELAERIGISQGSLSSYENGKDIPSVNTLIRMADVFNCTLDELVERRVS